MSDVDELSPADILSSDRLNEIGRKLKLVQSVRDQVNEAPHAQISVSVDVQSILDDAVLLYKHSKALSIGINVEIDTP